jgi:hypothetical protein
MLAEVQALELRELAARAVEEMVLRQPITFLADLEMLTQAQVVAVHGQALAHSAVTAEVDWLSFAIQIHF